MAVSEFATILTTHGAKDVGELVNIPFDAVVNGQVFPCDDGFVETGETDFYTLETTRGFVAHVSHDQKFLSEKEGFKELNDFYFNEKIALAFSPDVPVTDMYEDIESLKEFTILEDKDSFFLFDDDNPNEVRNALLRLGIFSEVKFMGRKAVGALVSRRSVERFIDLIGFNSIEQEERAYGLVQNFDFPEFFYTRYKRTEFNYSGMGYSCVIPGAEAFDGDCFYMGAFS